MDPITALTIVSAGTGVFKGIAGYQQGISEAQQQELNAELAETQAIQRDAMAREDLLRAESSTRAARAANGLSSTSSNAFNIWKERRTASDRDRMTAYGDDMQRAANFRTAAKTAKRGATWSLVSGLTTAAVPIKDFGIYKGWF